MTHLQATAAPVDTSRAAQHSEVNRDLSNYKQFLPGDAQKTAKKLGLADPGAQASSELASLVGEGQESTPLTFGGAVGDGTGGSEFNIAQSWHKSISDKSDTVYNAGVNLTEKLKQIQSATDATEAAKLQAEFDQELGRFIESLAPGASTAPTPTEGETTSTSDTEDLYVADEGARNQQYKEHLKFFTDVYMYNTMKPGDQAGVDIDRVDSDIAAINSLLDSRLGGEPAQAAAQPAPEVVDEAPDSSVTPDPPVEGHWDEVAVIVSNLQQESTPITAKDYTPKYAPNERPQTVGGRLARLATTGEIARIEGNPPQYMAISEPEVEPVEDAVQPELPIEPPPVPAPEPAPDVNNVTVNVAGVEHSFVRDTSRENIKGIDLDDTESMPYGVEHMVTGHSGMSAEEVFNKVLREGVITTKTGNVHASIGPFYRLSRSTGGGTSYGFILGTDTLRNIQGATFGGIGDGYQVYVPGDLNVNEHIIGVIMDHKVYMNPDQISKASTAPPPAPDPDEVSQAEQDAINAAFDEGDDLFGSDGEVESPATQGEQLNEFYNFYATQATKNGLDFLKKMRKAIVDGKRNVGDQELHLKAIDLVINTYARISAQQAKKDSEQASYGLPGVQGNTVFFKSTMSSVQHQHLSNFSAFGLSEGNTFYPTLEHYFQAMKFPVDSAVRKQIQRAASASAAKDIANENRDKEIKDVDKDKIMRDGIALKYQSTIEYRGKTLAQHLVLTEGLELKHIENTPSRIPVWGVMGVINPVLDDKGEPTGQSHWELVGENKLGVMLMEYRDGLISGDIAYPEGVSAESSVHSAMTHSEIYNGKELSNSGVPDTHIYVKGSRSILTQQARRIGIIGSSQHYVRTKLEAKKNETPDAARARREDLEGLLPNAAKRFKFITEESDYVESKHKEMVLTRLMNIDTADALARELGHQLAAKGHITVSGAAYGPDRTAMSAALSKGGYVIGTYPLGTGQTAGQYYPNYPSKWGGWSSHLVGVSTYPHTQNIPDRNSPEGNTPETGRLVTSALFRRNTLTAGLSDIIVVTAASSADSGTINTAMRALQAGKPVMVMHPDWFAGNDITGNAELIGRENVYVIPAPAIEAGSTAEDYIDGALLEEYAMAILDYHNKGDISPEMSQVADDLRTAAEEYSEVDFIIQIEGFKNQAQDAMAAGDVVNAIKFNFRVRQMVKLKAEKDSPADKSVAENYGYHTHLSGEEQNVRGGSIGLNNYESFESFHIALTSSGNTKVFVDTRVNPFVNTRGDDGKWGYTWKHGTELDRMLSEVGIKYVHATQFAPTHDTRRHQAAAHDIANLKDMELDDAYVNAYYEQIKQSGADLGLFFKEVIAQHIGYANLSDAPGVIFGCVEPGPRQCHRSLIGNIARNVLAIEYDEHGPHEDHGPHAETRDTIIPEQPSIQPSLYSARNEANTDDRSLIPPKNIDSVLVAVEKNQDGTNTAVYRSNKFGGWQVLIGQREDGTLKIGYRGPIFDTIDDIQDTAFADSTLLPIDKQYSDIKNIPEVAERALVSLATARANAEWFGVRSFVGAHPSNELIPNTADREAKRMEVGVEWREVGDSVLEVGMTRSDTRLGQFGGTAATGQSVTVPDVTENTRLHYKFNSLEWVSNMRVRLSGDSKYLELASIGDSPVAVPTFMPTHVKLLENYEDMIVRFNRSEESNMTAVEATWEFLRDDPRLYSDNGQEGDDGNPRGRDVDDLPMNIESMRADIREAVYGADMRDKSKRTTFPDAQTHFGLVKSFIRRGDRIRRLRMKSGMDEASIANTEQWTQQEIDAAEHYARNMPVAPNVPSQAYSYLAAAVDSIRDVPMPGAKMHPTHLSKGYVERQGNGVTPLNQDGDELDYLSDADEIQRTVEQDTVQDWIVETLDTDYVEEGITDTEESDIEDDTPESERPRRIPIGHRTNVHRVLSDHSNDFMTKWRNGEMRLENKPSKNKLVAKTIVMLRSAHKVKLDENLTKKDKEQMRGVIAELDKWLSRDNRYDFREWEKDVGVFRHAMGTLSDAQKLIRKAGLEFELFGFEMSMPYKKEDFQQEDLTLFDKLLKYTAFGTRRNDLLQADNRRGSLRVVATNGGAVVPVGVGSLYSVNPETNEIYKKPPQMIDKTVAIAQEQNLDWHDKLRTLAEGIEITQEQYDSILEGNSVPELVESHPKTLEQMLVIARELNAREHNIFYDPTAKHRRFKVLADSGESMSAMIEGTDMVFHLDKSTNRVKLSQDLSPREWNFDHRTMVHQMRMEGVLVKGWQGAGLQVAEDSQFVSKDHNAALAISMATRDGLFGQTYQMELDLDAIDLSPEDPTIETQWEYVMSPNNEFLLPDGNKVVSGFDGELRFQVALVNEGDGYIYNVRAFLNGAQVSIFGDQLNESGELKPRRARVTIDGDVRRPYDLIRQLLLHHQKDVAFDNHWELPEADMELEEEPSEKEILVGFSEEQHRNIGQTESEEEDWGSYPPRITRPASWDSFSSRISEKHGSGIVTDIENAVKDTITTVEAFQDAVSAMPYSQEIKDDLIKSIPALVKHEVNRRGIWESFGLVTKNVDGFRKVMSRKNFPNYRLTSLEGSSTTRIWYHNGIRTPDEMPTRKAGWQVVQEIATPDGRMGEMATNIIPGAALEQNKENEAFTNAVIHQYEDGSIVWNPTPTTQVIFDATNGSVTGFISPVDPNVSVGEAAQQDIVTLLKSMESPSRKTDKPPVIRQRQANNAEKQQRLDEAFERSRKSRITPRPKDLDAHGVAHTKRFVDQSVFNSAIAQYQQVVIIQEQLAQEERSRELETNQPQDSESAEKLVAFRTIVELPNDSETVGYNKADNTVIARKAVRVFRLPDQTSVQMELHVPPDQSKDWDRYEYDWGEAFGFSAQDVYDMRTSFSNTSAFSEEHKTIIQAGQALYRSRRDEVGDPNPSKRDDDQNTYFFTRYPMLEEQYREERENEGEREDDGGLLLNAEARAEWRSLLHEVATVSEINAFMRRDIFGGKDEFTRFIFNNFLPTRMWTPLSANEFSNYRRGNFQNLKKIALGEIQSNKKAYTERAEEVHKTHMRVVYKDLATGKYIQLHDGGKWSEDVHTIDPASPSGLGDYTGGVTRFRTVVGATGVHPQRVPFGVAGESYSETAIARKNTSLDERFVNDITDQLIRTHKRVDDVYQEVNSVSNNHLMAQLETRWRKATGVEPRIRMSARGGQGSAARAAFTENWMSPQSVDQSVVTELQSEIQTLVTEFVELIDETNKNRKQGDPIQPTRGLKPHGVPLGVEGTDASIEVVGIDPSTGERHYTTSRHLLDVSVRRDGDTFTATVTHADGIGTLTVSGIPEHGEADALSNKSQMSPAVREIYEADRMFQGETEVQLQLNSFDSAAAVAMQSYFKYAQDSNARNPEYPNLEYASDNFWVRPSAGTNTKPVQLLSTSDALSEDGRDRLDVAARIGQYQQNVRQDVTKEAIEQGLFEIQKLEAQDRALRRQVEHIRARSAKVNATLRNHQDQLNLVEKMNLHTMFKAGERSAQQAAIDAELGQESSIRRTPGTYPVRFRHVINEIQSRIDLTPASDGDMIKHLQHMIGLVQAIESDWKQVVGALPAQISSTVTRIDELKGGILEGYVTIRQHQNARLRIRNAIAESDRTRAANRDKQPHSRAWTEMDYLQTDIRNPERNMLDVYANQLAPLQLDVNSLKFAEGAAMTGSGPVMGIPEFAETIVAPTTEEHANMSIIRASYKLSANPFVMVNVKYEQIDGTVPNRLSIELVPRFSMSRVNTATAELELTGESQSGEDVVTTLASHFMNINRDIIESFLDPLHPSRARVIRKHKQRGSKDIVVSLAPHIEARAIDLGNGAWHIGFFNNQGEALYQGGIGDRRSGARERWEVIPGNIDLIENANPPWGILERHGYSQYVEANTGMRALRLAVLQKLVSGEDFEAGTSGDANMRVAIESHMQYAKDKETQERESRARLQRELGAVEDTKSSFDLEIEGASEDRRQEARASIRRRRFRVKSAEDARAREAREEAALIEQSQSELQDAEVSGPADADARQARWEEDYQAREHSRRAAAKASRNDGEVENPIYTEMDEDELKKHVDFELYERVPHGESDDAGHPTNQTMITSFIQAVMQGEARIADWHSKYYATRWGYRENIQKSIRSAEIEKYVEHQILGVKLKQEIETDIGVVNGEDAAARNVLLRSMMAEEESGGYEGGISPVLGFVATRAANITAADSVRIDAAGDSFAGILANARNPNNLLLVENNYTRKQVFRAAHPDMAHMIKSDNEHTGNRHDVYVTNNIEGVPVTELMKNVKFGGRLVLAGNTDWHRAAARAVSNINSEISESGMISKMDELNKGVDEKALASSLYNEFAKSEANLVGMMIFDGRDGYPGSSGSVIVIDNVGPHGSVTSDGINLGTLMETTARDSFAGNEMAKVFNRANLLAQTRLMTSEDHYKNRKAEVDKERALKQSKARAAKTIDTAIKRNVKITPAIPHLRQRVLALGHQAMNSTLIPKGTRVESLAELGTIAEMARHPSMANVQVLLMQNNVVHASVLASTNSAGDVDITAEEIQSIVPAAKAEGYQVAVVMNRPSGDTTMRQKDKDLTDEIAKVYDLQYMVIKNSGKYSGRAYHKGGSSSEANNKELNQITNTGIAENREMPSWLEGQDEGAMEEYRNEIKQMGTQMAEDISRLWDDHINTINRLVESEDNWVVLSLVNPDGTIADMVELPDAFDLETGQIGPAIERIRRMYGGVEIYAILKSDRNIQDNPAFHTDNAWGQFLGDNPNIAGSYLIGASASQEYARAHNPAGYSRTELTAVGSQTTDDRVIEVMPSQLRSLMQEVQGTGNSWNEAKAIFREGLLPRITQDRKLNESEIAMMQHQMHLAASMITMESRWNPHHADPKAAAPVISSIMKQFEGVNRQPETESDIAPLHGFGQPASPAIAYAMRYVASLTADDVVLIPNAGSGSLAAYGESSPALQILTEPDDAKRRGLSSKLGIPTFGVEPADMLNLSEFWLSDPQRSRVQPTAILLDVSSQPDFWRAVDQSLQTLKDGGRLVAHVKYDPKTFDEFKEEWAANIGEASKYYTIRGTIGFDGGVMVVIDKIGEMGEDVAPQARAVDVDNFANMLESTRQTRSQPESDIAQPVEPESQPELDVDVKPVGSNSPDTHAEHEQSYADEDIPRVNEHISHRRWLRETKEALESRIGEIDEAGIYELLAPYMNLEGKARDTAFEEALGGYRSGNWNNFILRLTAARTGMDPDIAYRFKLHELYDAYTDESGNIEINQMLDPRTGELRAEIHVAHHRNTGQPLTIEGATIADAKDAALFFQQFRDPAAEKSIGIFVDRNGEVVDFIGMSASDGYSTPQVNAAEIRRKIHSQNRIEKFWVVHQHPRYSASFSTDPTNKERKVYDEIAEVFGESYVGAVVTDTGEYAYMLRNAEPQNRQRIDAADQTIYEDVPSVIGRSVSPEVGAKEVTEMASKYQRKS